MTPLLNNGEYMKIITMCVVYSALIFAPIRDAYSFFPFLYWKFDASAQVGLDDATRNFLEGYPANIRSEVSSLVNESLSRVDISVYGYISRINTLINEQSTKLMCNVAAIKDIPSEVISSLNPFIKKYGPVEGLEKGWSSNSKKFDSDTNAHQYKIAYGDYFEKVAVARCRYSYSSLTISNMDDFISILKARWSIWKALDGECTSADNCSDFALKSLKQQIAQSDTDDINSAKALDELALLNKPKSKEGLFDSFNFEDYENYLLSLNKISLALVITKLRRESFVVMNLNSRNIDFSVFIQEANREMLRLNNIEFYDVNEMAVALNSLSEKMNEQKNTLSDIRPFSVQTRNYKEELIRASDYYLKIIHDRYNSLIPTLISSSAGIKLKPPRIELMPITLINQMPMSNGVIIGPPKPQVITGKATGNN